MKPALYLKSVIVGAVSFVSLLLFSTCIHAQADDNQWLPAPDGFVWPSLTDEQPKYTSNKQWVTELSQAEQAAVMESYGDAEEVPTMIEIGRADLNKDGKAEIFIPQQHRSGSGGPLFAIYTLTDNGEYRDIGHITNLPTFRITKNGWVLLEGYSRGGGGRYSRQLHAYKDGSYEIVRNEIHNFDQRKVKVDKGEQNDSLQD